MQKPASRKRPGFTHGFSVHPTSAPEVVNVDIVSSMLDEDLIVRVRAMDDERNRVIEAHGDPRPWEEEIAYVRREQQLRRIRHDAHVDYVRKAEDEFLRTEASLPTGEFDNLAFVYAATGGRPPRWS